MNEIVVNMPKSKDMCKIVRDPKNIDQVNVFDKTGHVVGRLKRFKNMGMEFKLTLEIWGELDWPDLSDCSIGCTVEGNTNEAHG